MTGKKWLQECEAACFLLFIHSETTAYGLVLPMFRMGLPTWVNPISQTYSEISLLGDFRSRQFDDINQHSINTQLIAGPEG